MVGYYIYLEFANTFFHFRSFGQDVITQLDGQTQTQAHG